METEIERSKRSPRVAIVRLRGRLDSLQAGRVRERLREVIDGGQPELVIDASNVAFIDSTGLSALIGGLRQARQSGGNLRLAAPSQAVSLVLQVTALDRVMRPYPSVEAAEAEAAGG